MESRLFGLRFSSRKNADKENADDYADTTPADLSADKSHKDAATEEFLERSSSAGETDKALDRQDSPPLIEDDATSPLTIRSTDMRLSKNNPSRVDDDFDIPNEPVVPGYTPAAPVVRGTNASESRPGVNPTAVIGSKIVIRGDVSGEEDLLIQGRVEGSVDLTGYQLTVGKDGVVKANLMAKSITVEGSVEGDLIAQERILIKASSHVTGNLVAERVTLEDGSKFRGSIDMESAKANASTKNAVASETGKSNKV